MVQYARTVKVTCPLNLYPEKKILITIDAYNVVVEVNENNNQYNYITVGESIPK